MMKKMFTILLSLLFIIRLKLKNNHNEYTYFFKCYGVHGQLIYRNLYNSTLKFSKLELDLDFLYKCKIYNFFPKFIRFKPYKLTLCCQHQISTNPGKLKYSHMKSILRNSQFPSRKPKQKHRNSARTNFSRIDFYQTNHWIDKEIQKHNKTTLLNHRKKLLNIRFNNKIALCNPQNVMLNFSSAIIYLHLQTLLAFGLDFCLPVYKLRKYQYFFLLESLVYRLKSKYGSFQNFPDSMRELQNSSFKYLYNFKPHKILSPIFTIGDLQSLQ